MKLKKTLSSLLALVLLIGGMTVTAQAETAPWADGATPSSKQIFYTAEKKVEPDDKTNYADGSSNYDSATKKGIMVFTQDITAIPENTFQFENNLTSVILPESVTSIGNGAFLSCSRLTSVSMPGVTSIGQSAFYQCSELVNINAPEVTSIGGSAFYECKKLVSVSLPKATSIGESAFYGCSELASIDLAKVTSIEEYAFDGCQKLTSISLPETTSIGGMAFLDCVLLATVNLPKVTSIGESAFASCSTLASINLPEVTSIGNGAFYSCSALKSVSIPKVTSVGSGVFAVCSELKYVCAPAGFVNDLQPGTLYDLTVEATGGSVSVSGIEVPDNCSLYIKANADVTLTATPDKGFKLDSITYTPSGGTATDITETKSFTMPTKAVAVKADFSINLDSETGSGQAAVDQYYTKNTTETTTNYKVGVSWTTETMEIEVNDAKIWDPVALAWKTNEETTANNGVASLKDGSNVRTFTFTNYSPEELKCNITFAVESTLSDKYTDFSVNGTNVVLAAVEAGENNTTNSTYLDENNNVDATKLPTASITCTVNPNLDGFKGADASASAVYGTYTITVGK